MRIIPAIDIIEGKCVRLTKGDYGTKKIYSESPLEIIYNFLRPGQSPENMHLHFQDRLHHFRVCQLGWTNKKRPP